MFMSLMGLVITATLFSMIAVTILALIPRFRVRVWSVVVFVLCEYAGAALFSMIYTPRVATPSGELTSTGAVLGYFGGVFTSAIASGIIVLWLVTLFFTRDTKHDATHKA